MKSKKYTEILKTTAIFPDRVSDFGKIYSYLGFMGEYRELLEEIENYIYSSKDKDTRNIIKEMGDVLWYAGQMYRQHDEIDSFHDLIYRISQIKENKYYSELESTYEDMRVSKLDRLSEYYKKYYRDGTPIPSLILDTYLINNLLYLGVICAELNFSIEDVMEVNYKKLISRKEQGKLKGSGSNRENKNE